MSIASPFIKRPVATSLLAAAIAIAGGVGFTQLPVAPLPDYPDPYDFMHKWPLV